MTIYVIMDYQSYTCRLSYMSYLKPSTCSKWLRLRQRFSCKWWSASSWSGDTTSQVAISRQNGKTERIHPCHNRGTSTKFSEFNSLGITLKIIINQYNHIKRWWILQKLYLLSFIVYLLHELYHYHHFKVLNALLSLTIFTMYHCMKCGMHHHSVLCIE